MAKMNDYFCGKIVKIKSEVDIEKNYKNIKSADIENEFG